MSPNRQDFLSQSTFLAQSSNQNLKSNPIHEQNSGFVKLRSKKIQGLDKLLNTPDFHQPQEHFCPQTLIIRPYEHAMTYISKFQNSLVQLSNTSFCQGNEEGLPHFRIAWIQPKGNTTKPNPSAFASRGISLEHLLFLESSNILQSLQSLCCEDFAPIIVTEGLRHKDLKIAERIGKKWVKPTQEFPLAKASQWVQEPKHKLFVLLED